LAASSTRAADPARRAGAVALVLAFASALAMPARAQSDRTARADALFAQGKQALEAGDFAHACPKLAESYAIDPSNGTLLALGLCHEGQGHTATAWRELRDAAGGAVKDGRTDRAQFALAHIAKLEPRLSTLTVVVPVDAPAGIGVEVDGTALASGDWGRPVPVDPGHHEIVAHVGGRKPWATGVDIGPEHDAQTVRIGALVSDTPSPPSPVAVVAPPPVATAPPPTSPTTDAAPAPDSAPAAGAWKRPTGWIVGGAGVVALGVGSYFGASAISKSNAAKSQCSLSLCTSRSAVSENNDAKTAATISDVTLGAGIVAVAVGAYLVLSAPTASPTSSAPRITPVVGIQHMGVAFEQAW
jgi:hypothetical protein